MNTKPLFKRVNRSTLLVPLVFALLLGVVGVSYAMWSGTLRVNVTVVTGELDVEIVRAYLSDTENVSGVGYNDYVGNITVNGQPETLDPVIPCANFTNGVAIVQGDLNYGESDKDYAWGEATLSPDGKTVTVKIHNAYPGYVNWLSIEIQNTGTIPLFFDYYIVNGTTLTKQQIGANHLALLDADGDCKPEVVVQLIDVLGQQMHPGDQRECSIRFMLLQDADENAEYVIEIELVAVQWSESIYYP